MRALRVVALALSLILALSALAAEINIDYHRDKDFSTYKTYCFREGRPAASAALHRHILSRLEEALTAAGLTRVEKDADLIVRYSVSLATVTESKKVLRESPLSGQPRWEYRDFVSEGSIVTQSAQTEGALVVDMEEYHSETQVWRGVASKYALMNGKQMDAETAVDQAIRLMFSGFPPKKPEPVKK